MRTFKQYIMAALALVSALVLVVPQAYAAGVTAGTVIGNRAYVDYQVSGIDQPQIGSSAAGNTTGAGSDTEFTVDKMFDVTVAAGAGGTVFTNQTSAPLIITVTNTGNTPTFFNLSSAEITDARPMLTIQPELWLDVNADGVVDGGDTLYVDETTFGSFSSDGVYQILVTGDISAAAVNGDTATVNLYANAYSAAGVEAVSTVSTGIGDGIALADGAGVDDAANDGEHSAVNTYTVSGAVLTITKTAAVYSDPVNGTTSPIAMPGAVVTYTITVANAGGGANATSVQVVDLLDVANLTFVDQFNDGVDTCGVAGQGIVIDNVCNDYGDADGSDYDITTGDTVTITGLAVNAGFSVEVKIQVTIN